MQRSDNTKTYDTMTKEDMFHDFKLICSLKAPFKSKVGMLTYLFSNHSSQWRVVGITENALERFKENEFKTKVGIGINRSHINHRHNTYQEMMNTDFQDCNQWWNFYYNNDKTILATSSENKKGEYSKIFPISEEQDLFKSSGYSWKHNKKERFFLQELYNTNLASN